MRKRAMSDRFDGQPAPVANSGVDLRGRSGHNPPSARLSPKWRDCDEELLRFLLLGVRSKSSLATENLFLRKQLAFYQERKIKPHRIAHPTRLSLLWLSRWFDW